MDIWHTNTNSSLLMAMRNYWPDMDSKEVAYYGLIGDSSGEQSRLSQSFPTWPFGHV
jgi:hypothetical protein